MPSPTMVCCALSAHRLPINIRGSRTVASPSPGSVAAPSAVLPQRGRKEGRGSQRRGFATEIERLADSRAGARKDKPEDDPRPRPSSWRQSLSNRVGQTRPDSPPFPPVSYVYFVLSYVPRAPSSTSLLILPYGLHRGHSPR